jgi:hypothetical protein
MKELIKELVRLAVLTAIVTIAFFGFVGFVALMLKGIEILPIYIGGFTTFILYVAFFLMIAAIMIKLKK